MGQSIKPHHISQAISVSQSLTHNTVVKLLSGKDMFFVKSKSNLSGGKQCCLLLNVYLSCDAAIR